MNIGFEAKRVFSNATGIGNYSRQVVGMMARHFPQHAYYLYTPRRTANADALQQFPHVHVKTPGNWAFSGLLPGLWRSYLINQDLVRDNIQLYHGLSNELPIRTSGKRTRMVVTIHDLLFRRFPSLYAPIDRKIYHAKIQYACRHSDRIITISQQTAEDLTDMYRVPPERMEVIYQTCHNRFKQPVHRAESDAVLHKYRLPQDFMLCVGTIEKRKNALLILQAMHILQHRLEMPLVMVGRATPYIKELLAFAARNRLTDRVIFLHQVPSNDLPALFQRAQLFIYPSIFEGFGIPIIEALYSGVPVITSQGSCFHEAGGDGAYYIDSENAEALATAIEKLTTDRKLAEEMIRKGKLHVQRFDEKKLAHQMMQLYSSLNP